jgi:hypothetical protein
MAMTVLAGAIVSMTTSGVFAQTNGNGDDPYKGSLIDRIMAQQGSNSGNEDNNEEEMECEEVEDEKDELEDEDEKEDEDEEGDVDEKDEEECVVENGDSNSSDVVPLKEAKLIIEHNDKDKDTGFQGFFDSEGWNTMTIIGPNGQVLEFEARDKLADLGLTELFFETVEPENADVPIDEVLETLPEGQYTFRGTSVELGEFNGTTIGTAILTHDIPRGPELLTPAEDEEVSADEDLLVDWQPVTETIDGHPVNIIAYQLIIEKDEEPHPNMIGKMALSIYLPADVTEMRIPHEFLEPGTDYEWEVLAIEESGNQTLMSSSFSTSD